MELRRDTAASRPSSDCNPSTRSLRAKSRGYQWSSRALCVSLAVEELPGVRRWDRSITRRTLGALCVCVIRNVTHSAVFCQAQPHSSLYCTMSRYNLFMSSWGWSESLSLCLSVCVCQKKREAGFFFLSLTPSSSSSSPPSPGWTELPPPLLFRPD